MRLVLLDVPGRAHPPGSALGRARPVRPVTALISPVVPFRATSFYYPPRQISAHVDEKTTTDCVALHHGGGQRSMQNQSGGRHPGVVPPGRAGQIVHRSLTPRA
jgi:hypothetical protein